MKTASPRSRVLRAITAMATVVAWICLALIPAAPAHADPVAVYLRQDVGCENGGIVRAYPPINVTTSARDDIARWRPTLTFWNGSEWQEYRKPRTYPAYAYILPGGINQGQNGGWRHETTHGQIKVWTFSGLPAGEYAVYHEVTLEQAEAYRTGYSAQTCTLS
jgi:hypothetical protein